MTLKQKMKWSKREVAQWGTYGESHPSWRRLKHEIEVNKQERLWDVTAAASSLLFHLDEMKWMFASVWMSHEPSAALTWEVNPDLRPEASSGQWKTAAIRLTPLTNRTSRCEVARRTVTEVPLHPTWAAVSLNSCLLLLGGFGREWGHREVMFNSRNPYSDDSLGPHMGEEDTSICSLRYLDIFKAALLSSTKFLFRHFPHQRCRLLLAWAT